MRESNYLEEREDVIRRLRSLPLLSAIDPNYLKEIIHRSKVRTYGPGEVVTQEGSMEKWIYILLSGSVSIRKERKEIARLTEIGDTFGEMAFIDGKNRSASVSTLENTVCLVIDTSFLSGSDKEQHLAFYAIFYQIIAEIMARRLRETSEELARVKAELDRCSGRS
jgi:CRP/FNR family cyclic AMP-dependent transcriptional regulator